MNDPCPICFKKLKKGKGIYGTECGHVFHAECIKHWMEKNVTCPIVSPVYRN